MTSANPASFPPIVMETRSVAAESGPSWLAVTSPVRAPEQAVNAKEEGAFAFFHSTG